MQVTLKETEIVAALKAHLGSSGVGVNGKDVQVKFTAGRKGDGLIAKISIDEPNELPGYGAADVPVKPHPTKVAAALNDRVSKATEGEATGAADAVEGVSADAQPAAVEAAAETASEDKPADEAKSEGAAAPSLFN